MAGNRSEIHVGDIGTEFLFIFRDEDDTAVDLTGVTSIHATFRNSEETFERNLTVVAPDSGTARYIVVNGELSVGGPWRVQGFVRFPGGSEFRTNIHRFRVWKNLPDATP